MARPSTRVAGHGQAPYKGGLPRPGHLQGGGRLWPRPPAKGRSAVAKAPYTGGDRLWQARRGDSRRWARSLAAGSRLLVRQLPKDKGSHRLRRDRGDGAVWMREEG
ncbi:hypothetical protein GW17_00047880 [Ensete ventricosum]|nr:hypothetical protein GW17_00047880 [Ensete ventricosum]